MEDAKIVIKSVDMNEAMQLEVSEIAKQAFTESVAEKDIAASIKRECDKKFGPTWHVVVGRNFGSYVTHETGYFIYFYYGHLAVLLFKSG
ncbi:dynein light chain LC6, flagellar outer arm-like protein [Kickxella alabastrina]|uniref:dynein light chain LC6, flagellar outer arm-like protein n=1 Tax=Kickxella alabastrina TaxID=61397 RepID=UPI00221E931F|nr:dynein light chain LC6, flagellar outer arm-like protein [Kickxella alabastrina]KAI7826433.1 dynein light chain LC6, flagellar outer arm-like protein [Kickxella alabastrina]